MCNSHISLLRCRQCTKPPTAEKHRNRTDKFAAWVKQLAKPGFIRGKSYSRDPSGKAPCDYNGKLLCIILSLFKTTFFYNYNITDILMYHIKNMVFEMANIGFFLKIMNYNLKLSNTLNIIFKSTFLPCFALDIYII